MSGRIGQLEGITGGLAAGLAGGIISGMQQGAARHRERVAEQAADCAEAASRGNAGVLHDTIAGLRRDLRDAASHIVVLQDTMKSIIRERDAARHDAAVLSRWIRDNKKSCRA